MKTIVITAGHSNVDPGSSGNGLTEAVVAADFRNMVVLYLKRAGAKFKTDGEGLVNQPLNYAASLIGPGDVAVEVHLNSFVQPTATGVETLSLEANRAFGAKLCASVSSVLGITNRGAKLDNSGQHSTLLFARKGGIVLELFFVSNPGDVAKYQEKKWLVAKEVAQVLLTEAGVNYVL